MLTYEEVISYLKTAVWRMCTFTVFNHATDKGWVIDVKNETGENIDIDDVEFVKIPLDEETKMSLNLGSKTTRNQIQNLCDEYNNEHNSSSAMYYIDDIVLLYVIRKKV